MTRDTELVKAELIDAIQDYAEIFQEKAVMETERFHVISAIATEVANGSVPTFGLEQSADFAKRYGLLEMRHDELKMRVLRLMIERG